MAKGIAAGLIGGLAASWVMNQFQAGLSKLQSKAKESQQSDDSKPAQTESQSADEEPATVKAAVAISTKVLHSALNTEEKQQAGQAVHYAFGAAVGGLYGAVAETWPTARAGAGVMFGSLLWLVSDEIGVPAAGFSKAPTEYPISVHASALGAHIVYGLGTELIRRALRSGVLAN